MKMNEYKLLTTENNDHHYRHQYVNPFELMIMRRRREEKRVKDNPVVFKIFSSINYCD